MQLRIRSGRLTRRSVSVSTSFFYGSGLFTITKPTAIVSALKTHPDRLPGGATPAQKKAATEKFQAVG